ncbi:MAG: DJ-1/PfpI family protein [Saprospiraceae bacterium]|nr:DJ-1/PfpI family protein [Saprospiraceae bacterium]
MKKSIIFLAIILIIASCKNKYEQSEKVTQSHDEIMENMFPKPKVDIKTIGILLYDGYSTLDAIGPYQVLGEMMGVDVFFVGIHKGLIADGRGMKIQCDTSIAEVKQLDILVIPGGFNETYMLTKDTTLLTWIKAIDKNSKYTTSVCTGAWILGATGLLKGKDATTHWYGKKVLAEQFGAKVQDKRFVKSGKYWTSAGITAGMDMSLALIDEIMGEKYTKTAMLDLEYDPQPPFKGGSEHNTDKEIVEALRTMYDGGMENVLHPEKAFKAMKFDNKKDFICGMPLTTDIADTVNYKGKVYGFCTPSCKEAFKKNPTLYLTSK